MRLWKIIKKIFKKKQKADPTPRIEKDTKCDKCEHLKTCLDKDNVIDCKTISDTRSHYICGKTGCIKNYE